MSESVETARRPETLNLVRRIGYRLLPGEGFSYILHLRPREWPIMAAHTVLGYLLAVGLAGATGEHLDRGLLGLLLWVVCLNGGTLALNSAFDRDEGDIAYLRNPPPPPERLALFSLGLMAAGPEIRTRRVACVAGGVTGAREFDHL